MKTIIAWLLLSVSLFAATHTPKDILVLHSYHRGYKWSDDISKTIEKHFSDRDNIFISTVYMDTKRVDTPDYLNSFYEHFKAQFKEYKFDVVMAVDNSALEFIREHYYSPKE